MIEVSCSVASGSDSSTSLLQSLLTQLHQQQLLFWMVACNFTVDYVLDHNVQAQCCLHSNAWGALQCTGGAGEAGGASGAGGVVFGIVQPRSLSYASTFVV
ncbi:MAG: hypothetical protein ACKPKO_40355, partial [Candidatus Fonsibacter sp.]